MRWIGLTGGIATGKSTVSQILRDQGCAVVDADQVARDVVRPGTRGYQKICEHFGPQILLKGGEIDRRALGKIVFAQPNELQRLEGILHPLIREQVQVLRSQIEAQKHTFAFYDVPLLFEKKMQLQFDKIVVVACSLEDQMKRIKERDGLSDAEIRDRLKAQVSLEEKIQGADEVIQNQGSLVDLENAVKRLIEKLKTNP